MIGWVIALAACPLMLSRRRAVQLLVVSELVVIAAMVPRPNNSTPWDATAGRGAGRGGGLGRG